MARWYVSIEGIGDDFLAFLGYTLVDEDDDFKAYLHYSGDVHIVAKEGPKFLYVDDLNDTLALRAARIIPGPDEGDC
ncbi:hypothetical protein [Parvibaculum sp.]|uniref:hypothetical protein n=1 Tax=Parvibaculum sp. TaxID=2024848 RepID=UPI000C4DAE14|nr:hypothetical protein [Parvibaculum sp.]MAM94080.1 hypothetical protein [Parvibaculum sp.]HCX66964.1 hypothetical protein [Rhodobiaceae bacterium]